MDQVKTKGKMDQRKLIKFTIFTAASSCETSVNTFSTMIKIYWSDQHSCLFLYEVLGFQLQF